MFIFPLLRELSRTLLLWQSEQRWCSQGKGEEIGQMVNPQPRRTTPTLRCGWLEKAGRRGYPIFVSNILICPRVDPEKAGTPPNRRVTTIVKGKNIGKCFKDLEYCLATWYSANWICTGYGATCECMVQSAIVILQETAR